MAKKKQKRDCSVADAKKRLVDARQFLEVAQSVESADVAAANAVLSAIAASDAICCYSLGERSSSQNHSDAVDLLQLVDKKLATKLKRTLDLKTKASYESADVSKSDAKACIRRAESLLEAAQQKVS